VVFDLETRRSAREVGGWNRAGEMGISVAVAWDSRTRRYHVFRQRDAARLGDLLHEADVVIGFNNRSFDNQVLAGLGVRGLGNLPTVDILDVVRGSLGMRLSLDNLACHTLGAAKNGNGLAALHWFAQGQWEKLIQYCRQDVALTRDLFLFTLHKGYLCYANRAGAVVAGAAEHEVGGDRGLGTLA